MKSLGNGRSFHIEKIADGVHVGRVTKNMKKKYQLKKVFDCQEMPEGVRKAFFKVEKYAGNPGNDCYVSWEVEPNYKDNFEQEASEIVGKWLIENGAKVGETVLVNHWW